MSSTSDPFTTSQALTAALVAAEADLRQRKPRAKIKHSTLLEMWVGDGIQDWLPVTTSRSVMRRVLDGNLTAEHPATFRVRSLK